MIRRTLRILALIFALALAAGTMFGGRVAGYFQHDHSGTSGAGANPSQQRKVLYWYDAMDPKRTYDKPGKADDGMELVPKYADEVIDLHVRQSAPQPAAGQGRKILYWYDAMDPKRTYDKPGKASDGMDLVPKYADADQPVAGAAKSGAPGERKILYWYDSMNPQRTYDKPGKASDGMDLVPKYADADQPGAAAAKTGASGERKVLYWYDAMNPQRTYNKPGKAPDGMDLVPKYAGDDEAALSKMAVGTVKVPPQQQEMIGVRTEIVRRENLMRTVRTTGQVTADETRIAHVHVKISGFIEKAFVDYVGQLVKKGQPLFTLYSPDLVSTQEEYLIAKRGEKNLGSSQFADVSQGAQSLLRSARIRLKLWDISDEQISKLDETGEVSRTLTFYSPISGFVMERKAFPQTSVTPDMDLYSITDLSNIWVNADVYEYEVPFVKIGQRAEMQLSYYPGRKYSGKITYIYPTVDPVSRTIKVRIEFPNPGFELKPQMFANVQLNINYGNQVVVPQEAVMDSGDRQYVFVVHDGGMFEPRTITPGAKFEGKVAVLSGLKAGETIVTSGNFLIDSESRLKSAMGGMKH